MCVSEQFEFLKNAQDYNLLQNMTKRIFVYTNPLDVSAQHPSASQKDQHKHCTYNILVTYLMMRFAS